MPNFDINLIKRENLRRIMDERGLTPTTLANLIGVKQPHISASLSGDRNIGNITIKKICDALHIDKSEFFVTSPREIKKPIAPPPSWEIKELYARLRKDIDAANAEAKETRAEVAREKHAMWAVINQQRTELENVRQVLRKVAQTGDLKDLKKISGSGN